MIRVYDTMMGPNTPPAPVVLLLLGRRHLRAFSFGVFLQRQLLVVPVLTEAVDLDTDVAEDQRARAGVDDVPVGRK